MTQHVSAAHAFIENARLSGSKCLIHCNQGTNRSGFIAVSYAMWYLQLDFAEAFALVKAKYHQVGRALLTNQSYRQQLVDIQAALKSKSREQPADSKSLRGRRMAPPVDFAERAGGA
eukprot:gnl/TRDRNA2_/TRDRNA2_92708_c0_seq1.p2 gnl/TRDRNA2_/TRDRNA2_92708_c0~~gnl/TRDRNA2_/TRDRNA2_92708_c0_seq1.p2  ORF type:complete len:117 (-),score=19.86 gnl/TRDRNA2_/TRDRNA2_92708_c0_seq1:100-450(-)